MRTKNLVLALVLTGVVALAGCGKSGKSKTPARTPGVVDLSALQQAFREPTPQLSQSLDRIRFSVRYRQFENAIVELDKLVQMPNLTDDQKKAINDVIEQAKAAMNAGPPAPPQ